MCGCVCVTLGNTYLCTTAQHLPEAVAVYDRGCVSWRGHSGALPAPCAHTCSYTRTRTHKTRRTKTVVNFIAIIHIVQTQNSHKQTLLNGQTSHLDCKNYGKTLSSTHTHIHAKPTLAHTHKHTHTRVNVITTGPV